MIRPSPKMFEDLAGMAGGVVNIASSFRLQIRNEIKARIEDTLTKMNAVPREEYEALQSSVQELRLQQEELLKKIEKLEKAKK